MVGIVIQGPTDFCKRIVDFYSGEAIQKDAVVVWSTWKNEPEENLEYISNSPINLVTTELPSFSGYLNVNYQVVSTLEGIKFLETLGVKTIIKIRSDIVWEGIEGMFDHFSDKNISFLNLNNRAKHEVKDWQNYYLDYKHVYQDFPSDHVIAGNLICLKDTFSFLVGEKNNIPPESLILHSYLSKFSTSTSFATMNLFHAGVDLFAIKAERMKNKIIWLKNNWELVSLSFNPAEKYIISL